jgi:hypothetical protein
MSVYLCEFKGIDFIMSYNLIQRLRHRTRTAETEAKTNFHAHVERHFVGKQTDLIRRTTHDLEWTSEGTRRWVVR